MTVAIIHQTNLASAVAGGIDTFVRDFHRYAGPDAVHLYGTYRKGDEVDDAAQSYIARLPAARRYIPDSLRVAFGILRHRRALKQHRTIHLHRIDYVPIVRAVLPRCRIVLFLHTPAEAATIAGSDSLWRAIAFAYRAWESLALRFAARIFCFSQVEAFRLVQEGYDAVSLQATYDPEFFFPGLPEHRTPGRVLWVGRFEEPKDPMLAADVMDLLSRSRHPMMTECIMVGSGALAKQLALRARQGTPVDIRSPVDRASLASLMRSASVLLMTSRFEGAPRVAVEALACNLPIVCTRESDPERLTDNDPCSIAVSRNAAELAQAAARVLERTCRTRSLPEDRNVAVQIRSLVNA